MADYFSPRNQNVQPAPAVPWYTNDGLSECSLLPSPICEDIVTPGDGCLWNEQFSQNNDMDMMYDWQTQNWLLDNDVELDSPTDMNFEPTTKASPICHKVSRPAGDQFQPSLSQAELQKLTEIALGRLTPSPSPSSSLPDSPPERLSQLASHLPRRSERQDSAISAPSRKRGRPSMDSGSRRKSSKSSHNEVEKKYRTNLNSKIAELRECIPALRTPPYADESEQADNGHVSKAVILTQAVDHITMLKNDINRQKREIQVLKSMVRMYQPTLVKTN